MTGSSQTNVILLDSRGDVDDPHWWAKVVEGGDIEALQSAVSDKPEGLLWQDKYGRTLLHVAAKFDQTSVIQLLADLHFDLDAQDQHGNTPLHEAVQHKSVNSIHILINVGASVTKKNNAGFCALIYAADCNLLESVEALLKHQDIIDPNIADDSGSTALHHAAAKNYAQVLMYLWNNGATPGVTNNVGLGVLHVAAYAGADEVLRVSVEASGRVFKKDEMEFYVNLRDSEGNLPLHAAVDSGSLESVRALLSHAHIDAQQEDLSTPVHFAALRGELIMIKIMLEMQAERKLRVLNLTDINGMTVLHKAVLFDNEAVAEYLLDQGAQIDVADANEQTPLLLAASKHSIKCVKLLLRRGSNGSFIDKDGRNFLHLIVLSGNPLTSLSQQEQSQCEYKKLLNQKDYFGCAPIHYASIEGHLSAADDLIRTGAQLKVRTYNRITALHFAAKYGRFFMCKKLLESPDGSHIINAADVDGLTALHFAAEQGDVNIIELLLQRGAIFHRTYRGDTAFIYAARGGHIKAMKLMLTVNHNLLNLSCKSGNTALHLAATLGHWQTVDYLLNEGAEIKLNAEGFSFLDLAIKHGNQDVGAIAVRHDRWREVLSTVSPIYPSPIFGLIEEFPSICSRVLRRCVTDNQKSPRSEDYAVTYDFTFLELNRPKANGEADKSMIYKLLSESSLSKGSKRLKPSSADASQAQPKATSSYSPASRYDENKLKEIRESCLPVLSHMIKFGRVELLSSPVCSAYLKMKWDVYGRRQVLMLLAIHLYAIVVLAVTVSESIGPLNCFLVVNENCDLMDNETCIEQYLATSLCTPSTALYVCQWLLFIFCITRIPYVFAYAISKKLVLLLDASNFLGLVVMVSLLTFTIPTIASGNTEIIQEYQWNLLAVAVTCQYFVFILDLKITGFGLYVVMFTEIVKTLLKCLITFVCLLIGFALAFTVLFQVPVESPSDYSTYIGAFAYANPFISLLRVLVMFTGELEFLDTLIGGLTNPEMSKAVPFPVTTCVVFMLFTILITIALYNLIIGLAIGDIKVVRSYATLKRLSNQVSTYAIIEGNFTRNGLQWFNLIGNPRPESVTEYPNRRVSFWRTALDFIHHFGLQTGQVKVLDQALERSNRLQFEKVLKKKMEKERQRLKNIRFAMNKQSELTKLLLQKMEVQWDTVLLKDEGPRSRNFEREFRSVKSTAVTDWDRLKSVLKQRKSSWKSEEAQSSEESSQKTYL